MGAPAGNRFLPGGGAVDLVGVGGGGGGPAATIPPEEKERLYSCILQLSQPETREEALQELRLDPQQRKLNDSN